ncbi:MAG: hypothetical protein AAEJ52_11475, partial [Myxococcota bacterium]
STRHASSLGVGFFTRQVSIRLRLVGQIHDLDIGRNDFGQVQLFDEFDGTFYQAARMDTIATHRTQTELRALPGLLSAHFSHR